MGRSQTATLPLIPLPRGTVLLPGLAYQLGILFAAPVGTVEFALGHRWGYAPAMAGFILITLVFGAVVVALGPERRGVDFVAASPAVARGEPLADGPREPHERPR